MNYNNKIDVIKERENTSFLVLPNKKRDSLVIWTFLLNMVQHNANTQLSISYDISSHTKFQAFSSIAFERLRKVCAN